MDAPALTKLLSPEGWALLNSLPPYDEKQAMALATRLRADGVDPELAAAALTQSRLRAKARAKLGDFADGMLFTPAGLEQATRLTVAALHARRYLAAGVTKVADLTCGVGADSLAFAGVGLRVLATDVDEATAAIATVNLRHFPEAEVRHTDGLGLDLAAEGVDGVYADPARRTRGGKRVFDPAAYAPPLDAVWALRDRVPALGIKIGPGVPHHGLPADAETQWVSVDGDVVEAGLWFGPLAPDGPGRSALVLTTARDGGGTLARSLRHTAGEDDPLPDVGAVGSYLYEPDGAVIRAGLVDEVARRVGGPLLDPAIAYVTADRLTPTPYATAYEITDTLPFGLKRLKSLLRERGITSLTIKKRGFAMTPEELRRKLRLPGGGPATATLFLTRIGTDPVMLLGHPA
jgi:hypothetical protein